MLTNLIAVPTGTAYTVKINYATNKDTQAINWLTPEQTAGKKLPYMFTQCEPIHCRAVAPLQDTPAIKATYTASVTVAKQYKVKMSAVDKDQTNVDDQHIKYTFEQTIPIASYLLAMAVGDLAEKKVGDRTAVITEPSMLDACATELVDLELSLKAMEDYLTPYIWGTYNVLVLPPSFPFGGMENPLMTFASPTIIVGDKSQVYVATHEIAHSWTGNEVTCENWSNMWLNEGFTVFEERNVTAKLQNSEDFSKVASILGNADLQDAIKSYGPDSSFGSLYPIHNGKSPDESFSTIPYEKGYQFLYYL